MSFDVERVPSDEVLPGDRDDRCIYVRPYADQPLVRVDFDEATSADAEAHPSARVPRRLNVAYLPDSPERMQPDIGDLES